MGLGLGLDAAVDGLGARAGERGVVLVELPAQPLHEDLVRVGDRVRGSVRARFRDRVRVSCTRTSSAVLGGEGMCAAVGRGSTAW